MTLLSRIFGYIRDAVFARVFGAGLYTDAFFVAFTIPNILRRLFAEGAFSQAFVPVLAEYKNRRSHDETKRLIAHTAATFGAILLVIVAIGIVAAPILIYLFAPGYAGSPDKLAITVEMLRIVFPYIFFISLVALAAGVLNTHNRFMVPAFTPILLNISFLTFALGLVGWFDPPVLALAWAVFVGGIAQLVFQIPFLARLGFVPRLTFDSKDQGVRRVLKLMGPAILGVSVSQISALINIMFASFLTTGSVSWLYYAQRLEQFPSAMLGAALGTILLPSLAKYHSVEGHDEFSRLLDWGLRLSLLLALPATVALMMLSTPLIATLFLYGQFTATDLAMVQPAVIAYSVGLLGIICIRVMAPGFYARHDIKTPFRIAAVCVVVTTVLNAILIWPLQHVGLALAVGIGASLNACILFFKLRKRGIYHPQPGWRKFALQVVIAVSAMALIIWLLVGSDARWINASAVQRVAHLCVLVVAAAATYFGALWLMGFRPRDFSKRVLA